VPSFPAADDEAAVCAEMLSENAEMMPIIARNLRFNIFKKTFPISADYVTIFTDLTEVFFL
jgi:hypothetical protein